MLANRFLDDYGTGKLDRLEVVYTRFISSSKQVTVLETLLPILDGRDRRRIRGRSADPFLFKLLYE